MWCLKYQVDNPRVVGERGRKMGRTRASDIIMVETGYLVNDDIIRSP